MVEAGRAFAAPLGIDSVIGFGGGSSLDCAKGINFLLTNGGHDGRLPRVRQGRDPLLPMIGVPTTAGTGSEAQSYAVISDAATHMKMACGASVGRGEDRDSRSRADADRASLGDGHGRLRCDRACRRNLGDDPPNAGLGHRSRNARGSLLSAAFERVLKQPGDVEHARRCSSGSHFAGMAIEQSMLGAAHACANPLTARYDLAHGLALSILLPHVVRWNAPAASDRYARARRIGGR